MITRFYKSLPQHLKVASISWVSRGIFVLATLYAIKIATSLLTVNQFAIYAVIANIVNWLLLTDLGLGYSVQNFISENRASKTSYKEYVLVCLSVTYFIGIIIGICLFIFNSFFTNLLFNKILSANSIKIEELNRSFLYSNIAGLLTGIGMVSHKILYAKQKGYWPNILNAFSAIITLTLLWYFKRYDIHNLTWVLLVFFIPNIVISFFPSLFMFIDAFVNCYVDLTTELIKNIYTKVTRRGINFFVFTLSSTIVLQIDYIVMSQTVSTSEISLYNIVFKIYSAFFLVYSTLLLALWPSIAEWYANKEFNKIITYCKKYILFGIIFIVLASVAFAYKTNLILSLISNLKFKISLLTISLFAIYFSVRVWTDTYSIILLSTSKVKLLWIFTPIQAAISISLQIILSKKIGINGILCALILSFLLTVTWGLPYQVRKILK